MAADSNGNGRNGKIGRPSVWEDPRTEEIVLRAYRLRMSTAEVAALAGIGSTTIKNRMREDPEFKAAVKAARAQTTQRALQGIVDEFDCEHDATRLHAKTWWAEKMVGIRGGVDHHHHVHPPELGGASDRQLDEAEAALERILIESEATTEDNGDAV